MRESAGPDSSKLLSNVFLAQIVITTILGVALSFAIDVGQEPAITNLLFVVFLGISISEVIMARLIVIKQLNTGDEGSTQQASVLASAFSGAIAIYGVVIGVLSGHWYFVLPFGVIAYVAWRYLGSLIQTHEENKDPYRFRSDP